MEFNMSRQFCAICAWRENCNKKFSVPDGGARCPDFSRDVSLKEPDTAKEPPNTAERPGKED
jgi:hypothetical protein